ncbi:putative membrane protein [Acinetobacter sp. 272263]|nr:putative membrane protein [Acinetobacter sp. 272263]
MYLKFFRILFLYYLVLLLFGDIEMKLTGLQLGIIISMLAYIASRF